MSLCALLSGAAPSSSLPNCQQLVVREMVCFPVSDSGPEDGTVYLLSPSAFLSEWLVAALSPPSSHRAFPSLTVLCCGYPGYISEQSKGLLLGIGTEAEYVSIWAGEGEAMCPPAVAWEKNGHPGPRPG